jgi:hypothetical protein
MGRRKGEGGGCCAGRDSATWLGALAVCLDLFLNVAALDTDTSPDIDTSPDTDTSSDTDTSLDTDTSNLSSISSVWCLSAGCSSIEGFTLWLALRL